VLVTKDRAIGDINYYFPTSPFQDQTIPIYKKFARGAITLGG
jgi:hypothetical protein